MTDLEELIATADKLCNSLDKIASNEIQFCNEISMDLEQYSHDVYKMANYIREIKETYGV